MLPSYLVSIKELLCLQTTLLENWNAESSRKMNEIRRMNAIFCKYLSDRKDVPNEVLKRAIEEGCDKDALLKIAVDYWLIETTRWLLENGANAKCVPLWYTSNVFMNVNFELLDLLLQYGADIKEDNKKLRCSILEVYQLERDVYKKLLQRGFRLDTKTRNWCSYKYGTYFQEYRKFLITHKWLLIKCAVKLLSLHQRAVVTANHPLRKLERGEFKDEE